MYGSTCASLLHKVGLAMLCIWLCWKRSLLPVLFSGQLLPDRTHNMWNDRMWHHRGSQTVWTQFSQMIIWFDSPISLTLCSGRAASPQHVWCSLGPCQPWQKKMQEQCQSERNAENSLDNQVGVYVYFHFPSNFKFRMELFLFMMFMCQTLCAFIFRFTQQKSTESRRDEPSIAEHLRTSCPFPLPSLWSLYLWLCWWRRVGLCTVVP